MSPTQTYNKLVLNDKKYMLKNFSVKNISVKIISLNSS